MELQTKYTTGTPDDIQTAFAATPADWGMYVAAYGGELQYLMLMGSGVINNDVAPPQHDPADRLLRIGSRRNTGAQKGTSEIAVAALWDRKIDESERDIVYAWGQAYMTRRGQLI